jgi:hypothetical protein
LSCTLTAVSTDADGDAISYAYTWIVNGVTSPFATQMLPSGNFSAGDTVVCVVRGYDGTAFGNPASDSVLIAP